MGESTPAEASLVEPILVERVLDPLPAEALAGRERDVLLARWEDRCWCRRRCRSAAGRDIALALPTGTTLAPGALLHVAPEWYLEVEAVPEPLLAICPRTAEEALHVAYAVGNRHFSLALDGDRLLVPDDPAMVQLLGRLGVPFARTEEVFCPIGRGLRYEH